jgi:hypothetical protein
MHLRGPMNVSQLAVYQVPSEAFKMRKRNTVPFYNRRRALKQRDLDVPEFYHSDDTYGALDLDKWTWKTTVNCSSVSTVTSTAFMTDCGRSSSSLVSTASPNITYTGPPLPCLPTPDTRPTTINAFDTSSINPPSPNCTCRSPTLTTKDRESQPEATLTFAPTYASTPITEKGVVGKRAAAWDRIAYYTSAAPAQATGFSFLANLGDPRKSGTFD